MRILQNPYDTTLLPIALQTRNIYGETAADMAHAYRSAATRNVDIEALLRGFALTHDDDWRERDAESIRLSVKKKKKKAREARSQGQGSINRRRWKSVGAGVARIQKSGAAAAGKEGSEADGATGEQGGGEAAAAAAGGISKEDVISRIKETAARRKEQQRVHDERLGAVKKLVETASFLRKRAVNSTTTDQEEVAELREKLGVGASRWLGMRGGSAKSNDISAWDPYAAAKAEAEAQRAGTGFTVLQRRAARNVVSFDEEGRLATSVAQLHEAPY